MDQATAQLIILGLTLADKLVFQVGPKLIELNTADLNDPAKIREALTAAAAEGFPQFKFVSGAK